MEYAQGEGRYGAQARNRDISSNVLTPTVKWKERDLLVRARIFSRSRHVNNVEKKRVPLANLLYNGSSPFISACPWLSELTLKINIKIIYNLRPCRRGKDLCAGPPRENVEN
jgi:hypothetical protein